VALKVIIPAFPAFEKDTRALVVILPNADREIFPALPSPEEVFRSAAVVLIEPDVLVRVMSLPLPVRAVALISPVTMSRLALRVTAPEVPEPVFGFMIPLEVSIPPCRLVTVTSPPVMPAPESIEQ
jgi:hypothetical protein